MYKLKTRSFDVVTLVSMRCFTDILQMHIRNRSHFITSPVNLLSVVIFCHQSTVYQVLHLQVSFPRLLQSVTGGGIDKPAHQNRSEIS